MVKVWLFVKIPFFNLWMVMFVLCTKYVFGRVIGYLFIDLRNYRHHVVVIAHCFIVRQPRFQLQMRKISCNGINMDVIGCNGKSDGNILKKSLCNFNGRFYWLGGEFGEKPIYSISFVFFFLRMVMIFLDSKFGRTFPVYISLDSWSFMLVNQLCMWVH